MNGEELLKLSFFIDYAVEDAINEFFEETDEDVDTDPYHFVHIITEWLEKNQGDETDPDILAQKWLDDEGYERIRERIKYFG